MPKSRAEARRERQRRAQRASDRNVWVDRAWKLFTHPAFAGGVLVLAGVVAALVPSTSLPGTPSHGWWVAASRVADAARGTVTLMIIAGFAGGAMWLEAWRRSTANAASKLPVAGVGLMAAGALVGLMSWATLQSEIPTSRVAIPPGKTIESFPAIETGRAFKVMLPVRVRLESVSPELAKATVSIEKAGEEEGVRNDVFVGDPLPIKEFDFALVGLEMDPTVMTAVMQMDENIEVRGAVGSKVQFRPPDGTQYEVKQVVRNFQGIMGPAVQLSSEETGSFWVFQRESELDKPLSDVALLEIETTPVAVFAVSRTNASQPAIAGGILFVLGFGLLLLFGDRRRGSIHEHGLALEEEP